MGDLSGLCWPRSPPWVPLVPVVNLHFYQEVDGGVGNGNPLQCSCLENPRDGGAWWVAVYGVTQSRTQLKWLSSSRRVPWFSLPGILSLNAEPLSQQLFPGPFLFLDIGSNDVYVLRYFDILMFWYMYKLWNNLVHMLRKGSTAVGI